MSDNRKRPPASDEATEVSEPAAARSANDATLPTLPGPPANPLPQATVAEESAVPSDSAVPDQTQHLGNTGPAALNRTEELPPSQGETPEQVHRSAATHEYTEVVSQEAQVAFRANQETTAGTLPCEEPPSRSAWGKPLGPADEPAVVQSLPGYEILGELGRGAMGVVYKARQVGLNRMVALKMVLAGPHAGSKVLLRFQIEAEAVARLQHPNVVQIYEVSEHDGMPFLALEFVEGGCLADHLEDKTIPARDAAWVVQQLALAMDCAHRSGVVHRDLKPANVLLARKAPGAAVGSPLTDFIPKVTDFGLAKRLEEDSSHTQAGSILGTPSYMAPEQAEGRNDLVGPAADTYALGAILYDLLTGRPPFQGKTVLDTLQQVKKLEPVSPRRLNPRLPHDLDTICLKCLEKAPARRYASAGELAEDLRRFLTGEPILARRTPTWERAWKYCKRRPAMAGLVGLSCCTLLGLLVGGYAYANVERERAEYESGLRKEAVDQKKLAEEKRQEADDARKLAEEKRQEAVEQKKLAEERRQFAHQRFEDAQAAVDFMLTRIGQERLQHEPHLEKVRRDLLEEALRFYNRFLKERSDDPQLRWQTALAFKKVGDIRRLLGQHEQAEKAFGSARGMLNELAQGAPTERKYRQDLAATNSNLGNLLSEIDRKADAEKAYEEARTAQQKLVAESLNQPQQGQTDREQLAASCHYLALVKQTQGQMEQALPLFQEALRLQEQLHKESPQRTDHVRELARTHGSLGQYFRESGDLRKAEDALRHSVDLLNELAPQGLGSSEDRQLLVQMRTRMGDLFEAVDAARAEEQYREAVKLGEALTDDFPTIPEYRQKLAASYHGLGVTLLAQGQRTEADRALQQGLKVQEKLASDFPRLAEYRRDLANSLINHGELMLTSQRLKESESASRRAAELLEPLIEKSPSVLDYQHQWGKALVNVVAVLQRSENLKEAEKVCREVLVKRKELAEGNLKNPAFQYEWARVESLLATIRQLMTEGQTKAGLEEAEKLYKSALAKLRVLAKANVRETDYRMDLAGSLNNFGELLRKMNRIEEALLSWNESAPILADLARANPKRPIYAAEQARVLHNVGVVLKGQGKLAEAEKSHRQALKLREKLVGEYAKEPAYRLDLASSHGELAIVLAGRNQLMQSVESFQRAIAVLHEAGQELADTPAFLKAELIHQTNLALLLGAVGTEQEVKKCQQRINAINQQLMKGTKP